MLNRRSLSVSHRHDLLAPLVSMLSPTPHRLSAAGRASERNFTRVYEVQNRASWDLGRTFIACLHSNQDIDKTATVLRFRNRINCYTGSWLTLVILGLITEKLRVVTFILRGPSTMYLLYSLS